MKRLHLLTLCSIALAAGIFFLKKRIPTTVAAGDGQVVPKEWLQVKKDARTPKADMRLADQTFLTFPEWFLVFSPDEQAKYFREHTATTFPYMAHTAQIWESYHIVNEQIKNDFPPNQGYHFMIWVIGSSASVEYSIKAWYETVIGRLTDTRTPETEEDKFNAIYTQSYVDLINDRPWYEYDFKSQLKNLYSDVPFVGSNIFRKLERRYILTSELLVKYAYGKLIGMGTKQVYEEALPTTAVILDNDSLVYLHRYNRFTPEATALAQKGYSFKEIAGNDNAMLMTVWIPASEERIFESSIPIFIQPITSAPSMKRIALTVPVSKLHTLLLQLDKEHIKVEHLFDY